MNKIARRVFVMLAIMGVLFMAVLAGFEVHKVYELRHNIERIQEFAKRNDIVLKQTEDVQDNGKVLFSIKTNSDTNLAVKVGEELFNSKQCYKDYRLFTKLHECSLEKDGEIITFSAKVDGEYYIVEKGTGISYKYKENNYGIYYGPKEEMHPEFNENGTRKRICIPANINEIEIAKANIKTCIESVIKNITPEADMEKLNIKVLLYSETDVDYTKFAQEDFLYLKEELTYAKRFATSAILLFLLYLFTTLSFIFSSRMGSRAVFAGIALFISVYVLEGTAAGMFLVLAIVAMLDIFLSFTKNRFVTVITYIVFSIILDAVIMNSAFVKFSFCIGIEICFKPIAGFIIYIVSAIDMLMCAMLFKSMRYTIRDININPYADLEKETVHVNLASSFLPYLSKIETKLSRYTKNSSLLSPKYKISVGDDLKENEYKIVKDGKVCSSKILGSSELTDMDIDILVGSTILAKHN